MTRFMVYPYTQASKGAKAIAEELGGQRILRQNSTYVYKAGDVIVNWGASDCPFPQALNAKTKGVTNKNAFFKRLDGTGLTPVSCITMAGAAGMNFPVFCRTEVEGHDGSGIVIANNPSELVPAKLYVEGVNKTAEYRLHVGRLSSGSVVLGAQKKWVPDASALANPNVWTGDGTELIWKPNGLPIVVPQVVTDVVLAAFDKFPELDFGAFDVVYNHGITSANSTFGFEKAYVLEINSAPLMTEKTAKIYGDFIRKVASEDAVMFQTAPPAMAMAATPEPVLLTISVPQQSITMVQNVLAAIGVHVQ